MTMLDAHPHEGTDVPPAADRSDAHATAQPQNRGRRFERRTLVESFKRLFRSSQVGIAATVVTIALLSGLSRLLGMNVMLANAIAVAAGTTVQFVGSRYYTFRATRGALDRQLKWFVAVEVAAAVLAQVAFFPLVRFLDLNRELANMISGNVVYFGFSYPMWHWVFKVDPAAAQPTAEVAAPPRDVRLTDAA